MSQVLEIVKPGAASSIQGDYRYGYFGQGIPMSGPMDEFSHHIGNLICGNAQDAPSIEFAMFGGEVKFLKDTVFAVTGAMFVPKLNGADVPLWTAVRAHAGDVLNLGISRKGCRGYLAIAGGFSITPVLGSTSTYVPGSIGGYRGRYFLVGDVLSDDDSVTAEKLSALEGRRYTRAEELFPGNVKTIKIMKGPQYDFFADDSVQEFLDVEWTTSSKLNRTGIRFESVEFRYKDREKDPDEGRHPANIIDDGIPVGGMQTPGGLGIILMMRDCVSAGGFTKIGVAIKASLDALGQLMPGEKVKFEFVELEEALACRKARADSFDEKYIVKQ